MIQEYLFSDKKLHSSVKEYNPDNVQIEFSDIENSDCWIAIYSTESNNEAAARRLSEVNEYIIGHYHPVVLSNESAAYFNKVLYPIFNSFERKLRKLLYLKSALNESDTSSENIKDLESKDLGTIYELLLTDERFVKSVRELVCKKKTGPFSKNEISEAILSQEEKTQWDVLIGEQAVPALRTGFLTVKDYRNDVMHAHNINYEVYKDARSLIEKVNKQLDTEIGLIIATTEKANKKEPNYNLALSEALQNMKQSYLSSEYTQMLAGIQANLSPGLLQIKEIASSIPKIQDYYPELPRLSEDLRMIQKTLDVSGLSAALSDFAKAIQPYQESLDTLRNLSTELRVMSAGLGDAGDKTQADYTEAACSYPEDIDNNGRDKEPT